MNYTARVGLAIGGLSLVVLIGFVLPLTYQTYRTVHEQQSDFARKSMEIDAFFVETYLRDRIHDVQSMRDCDSLRALLERSNGGWEALSPDERESSIKRLDAAWIAAESDNPLVVERMTNETAQYLKRVQERSGTEVGEIFLTDCYGVTVATTEKLTTLAHAHKYWWQAAYDEGNGQVFLDDRGFDTSVGANVVGFTVPVLSEERVIGILKVNYRVESLFQNAVLFEALIGPDWNLSVVRSNGEILAGGGAEYRTPPEVTAAFSVAGAVSGTLNAGSRQNHFVWSVIGSTTGAAENSFAFGGSAASVDHQSGNSGQYWVLVASVPEATIRRAVGDRMAPTLLIGIALLVVIGAGAVVLSKRLTRRVLGLKNAVTAVDGYRPEWNRLPKIDDEVGVLTAEFGALVERFRVTLEEKESLLIEQRKLNESLLEKEVLIREVNHRVKNNLVVVESLLTLKEGSKGCDLSDVKNQITSVKLVHELLCRGNELDSVGFRDYAQAILRSVFAARRDVDFRIDLGTDDWQIPSRSAGPLGLIINEIATNAAKHGFIPGGESRFVLSVDAREAEEPFTIRMSNTGTVLPDDAALKASPTLGFELITALVRQLRGTLEIERYPLTTFVLRISAGVAEVAGRMAGSVPETHSVIS